MENYELNMTTTFNLDIHKYGIDGKILASLERISTNFQGIMGTDDKEYSLNPIQVQGTGLFTMLHP